MLHCSGIGTNVTISITKAYYCNEIKVETLRCMGLQSLLELWIVLITIYGYSYKLVCTCITDQVWPVCVTLFKSVIHQSIWVWASQVDKDCSRQISETHACCHLYWESPYNNICFSCSATTRRFHRRWCEHYLHAQEYVHMKMLDRAQ